MQILLNIATHGDERVGVRVAHAVASFSLTHDAVVNVQVANKRALNEDRRFIDQDLNRSFPGKRDGNHEERLAFTLLPIVRAADVVIDIHSTKSALRDAVIVTKLDTATRALLAAFCPKYVLCMNVTKDSALISQAKIGIAFEYGNDTDAKVEHEIVEDIKRIFVYLGVLKGRGPRCRSRSSVYFDVFGEVPKPDGYTLLPNIKNYGLVSTGEMYASNGRDTLAAETDFYPILFSNFEYAGIFGFQACKIEQF